MLLLNTGQMKAGGSRVQAQPGLHKETPSKQASKQTNTLVSVSGHATSLVIKFLDFLLTHIFNFSKLFLLIKPIFH